MKLFDNYNRISLFFTVLIIIITGIVYYYTISYVLTGQVDQDLNVEEHEIFDHVRLNHKLPQVFKSEDLKISFQPVGKEVIRRQFINTDLWNEQEREKESARGLITSVSVDGINYRVTIIESKVETEDLIRVIFLITLFIIFLLILLLFIINRVLIRKLWQPFYQMLDQITQFNLTDKNTITAPDTRIDEFREMNREVTAMSLRVRSDYQELKNFVENASHELMTPIAVINSKLDTLVQDSSLTDNQGRLLGEVYQTLAKMKKMNKAMLLLSHIENRLIQEEEILDLKYRINDTLNEFHELFSSKKIQITASLQDASIRMNKSLLDILLNNLIGNAVNHNFEGGSINISLSQGNLTIANTGPSGALEKDMIFQRFNKSASSEGTGLGLTLVKEICETYAFGLIYNHENEMHIFSVQF